MKRSGKNSLIKLEYGAYFNAIHNLITLGILEDASYTYINIGEYSTIGQQLSMTYRAKRWTANVNATYIGRYNPDSEEADVDRYSFSPELGTNVRYFILQDRLQVNVFYKFNGQLQSFSVDEAGAVSTSRQAAYHILDLSFTADFLKEKNLSLTLGAKNLLNVQQVQVLGQAQSGVHSSSSAFNAARGVSVFLGLRYQFQFKNKDNEK
ncbi:MAG: hypothetical protein A3D92_12355 [Bacteroidetes bacterium RIFCSPHIGHO2_02_FULL_44_7]|nr:MAG: hypothetical protein A3D92_12355 [Bacteroidetes bacterium RIFCSPHIGHO2_02_FULL_44_7]